MTIGDPYSRDAAVSGRSVALPLINQPVPFEAGDPALERFRRNWLVSGIAEAGQARLAAARVLVVGAGGLGSPVLQYLTAAGVGTIGICDSDVVEVSNLQRQLLHGEGDVGDPKPDSAVRHLSGLNSQVSFERYGHATREWLDEHGREWDLIMDCTDSFDSKYLVADYCADSGVPLVWGTVVSMSFQVSVFWSGAPTPVPSLSLRSLHPVKPAPGTTPASPTVGVLGPVVGQAGTAMATEAIKVLVGFGEPLIGRVLMVDAATQRADVLTFAPWD